MFSIRKPYLPSRSLLNYSIKFLLSPTQPLPSLSMLFWFYRNGSRIAGSDEFKLEPKDSIIKPDFGFLILEIISK